MESRRLALIRRPGCSREEELKMAAPRRGGGRGVSGAAPAREARPGGPGALPDRLGGLQYRAGAVAETLAPEIPLLRGVERELDCGKIWTASRAVEGNTLRQVDTLGSGSCLVDFRPWSERPERSRARSRRHEAYNGGAEPLRWRDLGLGLGRVPPNWWREREKDLKRRGQRCHCRPSLRDQTQRTHPQSMVLNNALNSQA
ncbi:hypothetical protein NDU88_003020 [Pleurodeles waltl]|uniref:Uncharacterized protein n=1 Tax=Pleurodeles waltl TaxID=8319 RepID=A0AAV7KTP9_PLEWA|nr:hypothetical protein NDU88_003020 [Pleurodeles waltl]